MPSNLPPREFFTALGLETFDRSEIEERFEDGIDECVPIVEIGPLTFLASNVLKKMDPVSYRCAFVEYLDADGIEEYGSFYGLQEEVRMAERLWAAQMVIVEVMPDHLVASHEAAGNWGVWPHNGAERFLVRACDVPTYHRQVVGPATQDDKLDYRIQL